MRNGTRWSLGGVVLALLALFFGPKVFDAGSAPAPQGAATRTEHAVGFSSPEKLSEHFQKHGREFGRIEKEQYLALAQELRDRPTGGSVLEIVRADGVSTRFDKSSGAFLAFNRDHTIRTFFKPNDGVAYFERQAGREPEER